jgi:hypothetical protein
MSSANGNTNETGREIIQSALESVIGREETLRILQQAGQLAGSGSALRQRTQAGRIQSALEQAYGSQAGRGLAVLVGRACLGYSLRLLGGRSGLTDPAFRLLPLQKKLKAGSRKLADVFSLFGEVHVTPSEEASRFRFTVNETEERPCCAIAMGFLQEAYYWLSGGRNFLVSESECIAGGKPSCTIMIDRVPIG